MGEEQTGKKILMVLPGGRFEDNSYQKVRQIMERYGHSVEVASSKPSIIFGLNKTRVKPDYFWKDVDFGNYDVIYFPAGIGAQEFFDDKDLHEALRAAHEKGCMLAAIGNTPLIFARAGLLKGKQATLIFFESGKLRDSGGEYTGKTLTFDGNIFTGKGPEVSDKFGLALMKLLKGESLPYVP